MENALMNESPGEVDAGIVTKWIERYYEEKLDKREKKGGVSAKARSNPFLAQLFYLN